MLFSNFKGFRMIYPCRYGMIKNDMESRTNADRIMDPARRRMEK